MKKFFIIFCFLFLLFSCKDNHNLFTPKTLIWEDCDQEKFEHWFQNDTIDENLQCGILEVPLDYNNIEWEKISLAITKMPAKSENPIGTAIVVMGWPWQSGINFSENYLWENEFITDFSDNFDVIWYAPRGIFPSIPFIECWAENKLSSRPIELVEQCKKHSWENFLRNISTLEAVEDINSIRKSINEEKITLIGYSYGTQVVAYFANTYSKHLRAGVLDGVVDITKSFTSNWMKQEEWFQKSFEKFAEYCTKNEKCIIWNNNNFTQALHDELRKIEKQEITDWDGYIVTGNDILYIIMRWLYWEDEWDGLIEMLYELKNNKTTIYDELTRSLTSFDDDIIYNGVFFSKDIANTAINCADFAPKMSERNRKQYIEQQRKIDELSTFDIFEPTPDEEYIDACFYWPFEWKLNTPPSIPENTAPLLFISNTEDPATPHENAISMAEKYKSPLLTLYGSNHSTSLSDFLPCADEVIVDFLKNPRNEIKKHNIMHCDSK